MLEIVPCPLPAIAAKTGIRPLIRSRFLAQPVVRIHPRDALPVQIEKHQRHHQPGYLHAKAEDPGRPRFGTHAEASGLART